MSLTGFADTLDLGGGEGALKLYEVEAGARADIGINVSDTSGDLAISGFSRAGEIEGSELLFAPDSGWTARSSSSYFTRSGVSQTAFALAVDPATPADIYRLEMQIAGKNGSLWGERERFYVKVTGGAAPPTVLLAAGSEWKYLDDGSDQQTAWKEPGFEDSGWASGPAELGYGDQDEATEVGYGGNASQKFITTYFRTTFPLTQAGGVTDLRLRLLYDDGVVVYLNGVEVARDNLAAGADAGTTADAARGGSDETAWVTFDIPAAALRDGENHLAAEIHQSSADSSDISFNLELSATFAPMLLVTESGLEYPTETGKTYQYESSTNLKTWAPEGAAQAGDGQPLRLDVTPTSDGGVFYRVRVE